MLIIFSASVAVIGVVQGFFLIDTLVAASYLAGKTEKAIQQFKKSPRLVSLVSWAVFLGALFAVILAVLIIPGVLFSWLIAYFSPTSDSRKVIVRVWIIAFLGGLCVLRLIWERVRQKGKGRRRRRN